MKRGDILVAALVGVVLLGGLYMFYLRPQEPGAEIVIQVEGVDTHVFPLFSESRNQQITVQGPVGSTTILMEDNRVRVIDSDCPDKVCVNMGWINRPTVPIACLPNRVIVSIRGEVNGDDIDLNTR